MGLTAASLHLLRPSPGADVTSAVASAYKKLGYSKAKADGPDTRGVALIDRGDFVSLHDSGNDELDTGELRELAVMLSKATKSVAIVTTVNDSDSFEFLLFHRGKQIDAAVGGDRPADGVVTLEGKKRARAWCTAFQDRDFQQVIAKGSAYGYTPEAYAARYATGVETAAGTESPFAETILGAWCTAAGLSAEAPCTTFRDCVENPSLTIARFSFVAAGPKKNATARADATGSASGAGGSTVQLAHVHDDDDGAHLLFCPAAWPVPTDGANTPQWFVVSTGTGFRGLVARVRIESVGDLNVRSAQIIAYPFYNGQVTSMTPVAKREFPTPCIELHVEADGQTSRSVVLDAPDFELPTLEQESKRQTLIIMSVDVETGSGGHAELTPEMRPIDAPASAPRMPALRLVWRAPEWTPLVCGAFPAAQTLDAIRRLNSPSCRAHLVVLPGDDGSARETYRALFESTLETFTPVAATRARVRTHKHMSASFSVSKNERWTEFATLRSDRGWDRLFDGEADYQSVFVDLFPPDALYPHAGLVMQATLRGSVLARVPMLSGGVWMLDHPDVFAAFGTTADAVGARFATWIRSTKAVQAWSQSAAWIPNFDTYDEYRQTPYESAVTPGWFGAGLAGAAHVGAWQGPRLRAIAPEMWLDESMLVDVDVPLLNRIAECERLGALTRIRLRVDASLNDLERLFASRLPVVVTGLR